MPLLLQVAARAGLGVAANAVQKRLVEDGATAGFLWAATHALMLPPAVAWALTATPPATAAFWRDALLAGLLDALGNLAMVAALRATDLSVFGPLNALRPLLALGFGWAFLHEQPSAAGAAGVVVTVAGGALLLSGKTGTAHKAGTAATAGVVGLRVVGLSLSAAGAVFLKRAATGGNAPWTLAVWVAAGGVLLGAVHGVRRMAARDGREAGRIGWKPLSLHAAAFLGMQALTIVVFQGTLLGYSFVFFQLGMVLQVVVGRVVFREPHFARRLAACLVMAAGAGLVLWKG